MFVMDEAGSAILRGDVRAGRCASRTCTSARRKASAKPVKASVGAGPCQLSGLVHFESGPIRDRFELSAALAEVFNAELLELQAAGCSYVQYEDLGVWTPNLTGEQDFAWVTETVNRVLAGVTVRKAWHFCLGNAWGNRLDARRARRVRRGRAALPRRRRRRAHARLRVPRDGRRGRAQGDPRRHGRGVSASSTSATSRSSSPSRSPSASVPRSASSAPSASRSRPTAA